jgi:prephenate dehydratase
MFWVDFIYENSLQKLEEIIKELKYFAKEVKIL